MYGLCMYAVHVQSKHVLNVSPQLYITYSYYQLLARKLQFLYDFYKCCNIESENSEPKGPISIVNFNLQKGQLKDPKGPRLARGPRSGDLWCTTYIQYSKLEMVILVNYLYCIM